MVRLRPAVAAQHAITDLLEWLYYSLRCACCTTITALHTGFRKSALWALRWKHVDFRHHLSTVEAA